MSIFKQVAFEIETSLQRILKNQKYKNIFNFLLVPNKIIVFKVSWTDKNGNLRWNTGYRVQFNNSLGPYKGGLRFNKNVNEDILKALALEQTFKNSLTGLSMGGGKGGADFDPSDKTENEIRNFCQSYMRELYKYIGDNIDIPAGDLGVGSKEIGYMYGEYKKITNECSGTLTGKGLLWGGSHIRPEATGYGVIYFLQNMLSYKNDNLENKNVIITGAGNVAIYAMEKALEYNANIIAINDISGSLLFNEKLNNNHLEFIKNIYEQRKTLSEFINYPVKDFSFININKPWFVNNIKNVDIIIPCATQNEIDENDAIKLVELGCKYISEGSNMSCNLEAISYLINNNVFFGPSKACNAGGVSVSGLEIVQNAGKTYFTREEVDDKLKNIMKNIFDNCIKIGKEYKIDTDKDEEILIIGANIGGFLKISQSLIEQGYFY